MQALQRLLFVFSKLNSGLKYVQGMNELVAPLYMVFYTDAATEEAAKGAEADTFFCFIRVLTISETRDLYCKTLDTATTGVASVMAEYAPHFPTYLQDNRGENSQPWELYCKHFGHYRYRSSKPYAEYTLNSNMLSPSLRRSDQSACAVI